jgi:hypothetical protein
VCAPDRFSSRVFALAAVALLAYLLYRIFEPFFGPILWGTLVAFLLFPANLRLRRAVRGRLGLACTTGEQQQQRDAESQRSLSGQGHFLSPIPHAHALPSHTLSAARSRS